MYILFPVQCAANQEYRDAFYIKFIYQMFQGPASGKGTIYRFLALLQLLSADYRYRNVSKYQLAYDCKYYRKIIYQIT